jgi:sugar phosphate isomerase/epimerase
MRFGISSYAYTWAIGVPGKIPANPLDYYGLLKRAIELNVDTIQIADNLPLHLLNDTELIKFKNTCHKYSIHLEAGARGMSESNLENYVRIADLAGSPLLRFVIDGPEFSPDSDMIVGILKNVLPELIEKNIILALENYERFKAREFASIIERIGSTQIGICLDSVNSIGAAESIETVVQLLGPYTVNLHIKEFSIKRIYHRMGFHVEGLPVGDGMLNVPWLIEKVNKSCQSAILEQWIPPEKNIEETILKEHDWASKSITYLKSIL